MLVAVNSTLSAITLVSAEPSSAGNAPDNCAEGRFVRDAPEPENVVAVAIPAVIVPAVSIVSLAVPFTEFTIFSAAVCTTVLPVWIAVASIPVRFAPFP